MKLPSILLGAALLAACGNSSAQPTPSATPPYAGAGGHGASDPAAASGPQDWCEVHLTGDETYSFVGTRPRGERGGGKIVAETDYWMSDAELEQGLTMLAGLGKKSKDEIADEVAQKMKRDPRFMLLLINCSVDGQGFLNLSPVDGSRYADVPFKPGSYRLVGTEGAKPGDFRAMVSIQPGGKREGFAVTEPGTIEITRFDATGIAGTFAFKAESHTGKKSVAVTGSFDYGCGYGSRCPR